MERRRDEKKEEENMKKKIRRAKTKFRKSTYLKETKHSHRGEKRVI